MFNTFILVSNYCQLPLCIFALTNNMMLLFLLKCRRPFTSNVRLLLSAAAVSHCFYSIYIAIKALLVILSYNLNFSILLSKVACFALAGFFAVVPLELSTFLIWLILLERLYASLKFKENAEISRRLLYVAIIAAIVISIAFLLYMYLTADDHPISVADHCDVLFFVNRSNLYMFLFYRKVPNKRAARLFPYFRIGEHGITP